MNKMLVSIALAALALAGQYGKVRVTTVVREGRVTSWNVGCPEPGKSSGTVYNMATVTRGMSERESAELLRLINQIESRHGTRVGSKTQVKNRTTQRDTVTTNAVAPEGDSTAASLCDLLKASKT
jgi:hypothetical protein